MGKLTFSYTTYVNTDYKIPKPFIKGTFELEDKRADPWPTVDQDDLQVRICMHFGYESADLPDREILKWEI